MADEFVRTGEFGQFVKRIDERFDHLNELADQRFDSVSQRFFDMQKRMEQGFTHVDQRFDDIRAEVRSLRTIMFTLYVPIVVAVVGAVVKFLFFNS